MITVDEALGHLFALARPLGAEQVAIRQASGRVLAEPVSARRDQPPFSASAMDGYAIAGAATPGAGFTVIGQAANIAARLGDYGKTVSHPVVVSRDILSDPSQGIPLGAVSLHNVSQPVTCFAVPAAETPQAAAE